MTPVALSPDLPDFSALPWYGVDRTLPASRFIPGRSPQPARGLDAERTDIGMHEPWTPEQWPTLEAYLRGVDLFNRWYFWEAHEAWEPLWRAHPPQSEPARFIQGLIGAAAALLKARMGNARSAHTLSQAAEERLGSFQGVYMGLPVERFRNDLTRYCAAAGGATPSSGGTESPCIRLDRARPP